MSVKSKAGDYLQQIPHLKLTEAYLVLLALIENGAIHADDVWPAKRLIDAFEQVMGDDYE